MVIFVDSTEEQQSKVQEVKRFNKDLEVNSHKHNYYCRCGESSAVYLEDEKTEFIIVNCKNCNYA